MDQRTRRIVKIVFVSLIGLIVAAAVMLMSGGCSTSKPKPRTDRKVVATVCVGGVCREYEVVEHEHVGDGVVGITTAEGMSVRTYNAQVIFEEVRK